MGSSEIVRGWTGHAALLMLATVSVLANHAFAATTFRVGGLGDSFTEGWAPTVAGKFPYLDYMRQCMLNKTGGTIDVETTNAAKGWASVVMARSNLTTQVLDFISSAKSNNTKYDWTIIWTGGVNDFFNSKYQGTLQSVFDMTTALWQDLLEQGWGVLVMPQVSMLTRPRFSDEEYKRRNFTILAKDYINRASNAKLRYLDLEKLGLDGWSMSKADQSKYFDQVHLSEAGYNFVGQLTCEFMTAAALGQNLNDVKYTAINAPIDNVKLSGINSSKSGAAATWAHLPVAAWTATLLTVLALLV